MKWDELKRTLRKGIRKGIFPLTTDGREIPPEQAWGLITTSYSL